MYKNIITSDSTNLSSDIEDNEHDQCLESDRSQSHEPRTVGFSKHGWLLVSQGKYVVFFFNPITNQRIDLPGLPRDECIFDEISFSEAPTSPDCIVLAIHVQSFWVFFAFIRRGEDHWNSDRIYLESGFVPSYSSPAFTRDAYYFWDRLDVWLFLPKHRRER
uniref:KIB1-4 beta-propeller domain-containing protein n=1 Tax=Salix viminalis TaxID=40686 RepID=A0A6N2LCI2_SALVM